MPVLTSRIDPRSPAYAANAARMRERLDEVRALEAKVVAESRSKAERFARRGQLLPRERVARLIDRGSEPARLIAQGYGESRPVAPNNTNRGRDQNRRVEFVIVSCGESKQ